jgi:hypothetical protein
MTAINVPEFIKYNTDNPCVKVYQDAYKNYTQVRYLKTEVDKGEEDDEYYAGYRSVTMDKNRYNDRLRHCQNHANGNICCQV